MSDARPAITGRRRVAIEHVEPQVDCGRFPIKRVTGELVTVEADVFADGHDHVACALLHRREGDQDWTRVPMEALSNDRWRGEFRVPAMGRYQYAVEGWIDHLETWCADLKKRITAGEDIQVHARIGASLIENAARHAASGDARLLWNWAQRLRNETDPRERASIALDPDLFAITRRAPDLRFAVRTESELTVEVDRPKAGFSTWYELFPRSCSPEPGQHGTLHDCMARLEYAAAMGFDVVYLPPIHPIGRSFRKGKNNVVEAGPGDVGSPWAIGAEEGGHTAVHPELGTLDDFRRLISRAGQLGMEVAIDLAYQCSADHPYVHEHPEWFLRRPDGRIQYAENPPKKYQDIYPFDFESEYWTELWEELKNVALFWVAQGVRIFRVDNPHTKPFAFWEWLIREIKQRHPEVLFLSEAFTRPRLMERLAKLGFSQSYTYFAWRNTKAELTEYFEELAQSSAVEYLRPNLWPNTPDILTEYLQTGGRPAFMARLILAATLGANYGIYGPAFELCESTPRERGSEEYLNSEKYELKHWNVDDPKSLGDLITLVNRIRRENHALQSDRTLEFHPTDNPNVICYSKTAQEPANVVVMIVSLDTVWNQSGFVALDLDSLGIDSVAPFRVRDLLSDEVYTWRGARNYFELRPGVRPAHILRLEPRSHE